MIEDKSLGLKIAENEEEAIWSNMKKATEQRIKDYENALIVERELVKLATKKLSKFKSVQIVPSGVG